ncbi:MAG: non-canonical purine diphosphatase [Bacteriovoracaceae bacterium]|nr:non-canonical purine diphosphatase [Bacteriovoracaceae bacterium]
MTALKTTLVIASENSNKIKEMNELVGEFFHLISFKDVSPKLSLPEEGVTSYEENAAQKAIYVGSETGLLSLGDDSGFEVAALKNAPGVLSARFANTKDASVQRKEILRLIANSPDRTSAFVCVLAIYDPQNKKIHHFRGQVNGKVSLTERGSHGFGYDSIFIPDGYSETFAELSTEIKNEISHRALATNALKRQWLSREEASAFPQQIGEAVRH